MISRNRNILYFIFFIVIFLIFTLSIVYAALNTLLKISGNAEIVASSWDIYLDNAQLISGSVTNNAPTIIDKTTASFTTTLTNPGDYYMFTIDVVNNGSIDAMIDSIEKTPILTENQTKYLNYIVEYQNGESINTKQLVEANSFVRLKVKVEFRKDLSSSDLPSSTETLNLSFSVKYIQANDNEISNVLNNGKLVNVVSGDYDTVGSEICIDTECFYVISSTENDVTMLAKYNLHVNGYLDSSYGFNKFDSSTGIQDPLAIGWKKDSNNNPIFPYIGISSFSSNNYWWDSNSNKFLSDYVVDSFENNNFSYVFNNASSVYKYVENYKNYLMNLGVNIKSSRLIDFIELVELGCSVENNICNSNNAWVYSTSYWTGSVANENYVWIVTSFGRFSIDMYSVFSAYGVRPVVVIPKSEI